MNEGKSRYLQGCLFGVLLAIIFCIIFCPTTGSAAYKIKLNGTKVDFTGQFLEVFFDGKAIDQKNLPGLELVSDTAATVDNDRYMVNVLTVYKKGLGCTLKYNRKKQTITLKKNGHVLKMKIGSASAKLDGTSVTMPARVTKVRYLSQKKTCYLVDSEFVTQSLGYVYTWGNVSPTKGQVFINTPQVMTCGDQSFPLTDKEQSIVYEGKAVDYTDGQQPVLLGEYIYVPIQETFIDGFGAEGEINQKKNTVTLRHEQNELIMTVGSDKAMFNQTEVEMKYPLYYGKNKQTGYEGYMGPMSFIFQKLGYSYSYSESERKVTVTYGDRNYISWKTEECSAKNAVVSVLANYSAADGYERITITTKGTAEYVKAETESSLSLTFTGIANVLGEQNSSLKESTYLDKVTLSEQDGSTVLTISSKNQAPYYLKETTNEITIIYGASSAETPKQEEQKEDTQEQPSTPVNPNGIRIAVDCGHGMTTGGKCTPPLPYDIDIDGDGVIDLKKGDRMKEHQADVGVGKYLAAALERCGFSVYRSAFGDEDVPLKTRQANIKAAKCDYSVSIHFNASTAVNNFDSVEGSQILYHSIYPKDSAKLAAIVKQYLLLGTPQQDKGYIKDQWIMCDTNALGTKASILVECAFMTNLKEATTMMANAKFWQETAEEICQGMCKYTSVTYVKP